MVDFYRKSKSNSKPFLCDTQNALLQNEHNPGFNFEYTTFLHNYTKFYKNKNHSNSL